MVFETKLTQNQVKMEERKSLGAKGCQDPVRNAKWEIPDFFPRIGDNKIKDGCFPNRYGFSKSSFNPLKWQNRWQ